MRRYFVTRHPGAADWARRQGIEATLVSHLNLATVRPGDRVYGTLPVHLAAVVCAAGARYFHLSMDLPEAPRGRTDLSADEMDSCGARLERYQVTREDAVPDQIYVWPWLRRVPERGPLRLSLWQWPVVRRLPIMLPFLGSVLAGAWTADMAWQAAGNLLPPVLKAGLPAGWVPGSWLLANAVGADGGGGGPDS